MLGDPRVVASRVPRGKRVDAAPLSRLAWTEAMCRGVQVRQCFGGAGLAEPRSHPTARGLKCAQVKRLCFHRCIPAHAPAFGCFYAKVTMFGTREGLRCRSEELLKGGHRDPVPLSSCAQTAADVSHKGMSACC